MGRARGILDGRAQSPETHQFTKIMAADMIQEGVVFGPQAQLLPPQPHCHGERGTSVAVLAWSIPLGLHRSVPQRGDCFGRRAALAKTDRYRIGLMTSPKGKIVIAGGSGFLGVNLARAALAVNYEVAIVSRSSPNAAGDWTFARWDGRSLGDWIQALDGAAALVNLAGRSVDCIKTPDNVDEIVRSRVESTQILGTALKQVESPPPVWVQMSGASIYGDPPDLLCIEDSALGYGLAPFVCKIWEQTFQEAVLSDMRQVILRTSFVLGHGGGALPTLARLVKFGLGGKISHGQQGLSWLHEQDMNRIMLRAIEDTSMTGTYIASAPNPVSNEVFMRALRRTLRMPIGLPAAAWMVRIGAPLIARTDPELALYGRYVKSQRLEEEHFEFEFPDLDDALANIYSS